MTEELTVQPIGPLSRKNFMKCTIGKEEPTEFDILYITMGQILIMEPNIVNFKKEGSLRIFESDVNWLPDKDEMERMLSGGLIPFVEFGVNSSRVETAYRYCYQNVYYGNVNKYHSHVSGKDKGMIYFKKYAAIDNMYYLMLEKFGRYHWNG